VSEQVICLSPVIRSLFRCQCIIV